MEYGDTNNDGVIDSFDNVDPEHLEYI